MLPPIFALLQASAAVTSLIGNPPRVWRQGEAPQGEQRPYLTWLLVIGAPELQLSGAPLEDRASVQLDCYDRTDAGVVLLAHTVRAALEPAHAELTAWRQMPRDSQTRLYRQSMDFDFWVANAPPS